MKKSKPVPQYNNSAVIRRFVDEHKVSSVRAKALFVETLKFISLCANSAKPCSPSRVLDEMWHNFILFTEEYDRFCIKFFGRKIHHTPMAANDKRSRAYYRRTLRELTSKFGPLDQTIWPRALTVAAAGCGGGQCGGSCGSGCK